MTKMYFRFPESNDDKSPSFLTNNNAFRSPLILLSSVKFSIP